MHAKKQFRQMFCDGSSNQRGAGLGVVLKSPQGDMIVQSIYCDFKATNNKAEYEALIAGMTVALDLKETGLNVYRDSLLIASQLNGEFAAKVKKMTAYLEIAKRKAKQFNSFSIKKVPRDKNTQADALDNLGSALRKSPFSTIPLRCLIGDEQQEVLKEHHDRECGNHSRDQNNIELSADLDTSEELRKAVYVRMAAQQQIFARSFNKNVKAKVFKVGDWVLRKVFQNTKDPTDGKLGPTWEGSYQILDVAGKGAYRLMSKE
uniref:RNase H type-1 domain-containing protein n=1 Tax=Chenopodium quinoa TaxID=63459 RepID=A0A803M663_CHEQI